MIGQYISHKDLGAAQRLKIEVGGYLLLKGLMMQVQLRLSHGFYYFA